MKDNHITPVEVKSGKNGSMKSMQLFLDTHPNSSYGLKISELPFASQPRLQEIPFYGIEAWIKNSS